MAVAIDHSPKTATFKELWDNWPNLGRRDLMKTMGGNVPEMAADCTDDSAIRLSMAFNEAGHEITTSTMYSGVDIHDAHRKKVCIDPDDMKAYLIKKLGKPRHMKHQEAAAGRQGIVMFEKPKSLKGASHIDLWNGMKNASVEDYWTESENIWLWELD